MSVWYEMRHDMTSCSYYGREIYGKRRTHGFNEQGRLGGKGREGRANERSEALLVARGEFDQLEVLNS